MPAIIVNSLKLTDDQKKDLAYKITTAFSETTRVPPEKIYVFFQGYGVNNAASGGKLFEEHMPTGIIGDFTRD